MGFKDKLIKTFEKKFNIKIEDFEKCIEELMKNQEKIQQLEKFKKEQERKKC